LKAGLVFNVAFGNDDLAVVNRAGNEQAPIIVLDVNRAIKADVFIEDVNNVVILID